MFDQLWKDIQYAWRQVAQYPAFSLVIVITLTLGIGANTAIFSIINDQLLRPLNFAEPHRLLRIPAGTSYPDLVDVRSRSRGIAGIGGIRIQNFDLTQGPEPERIQGSLVTGDFFTVLGVAPMLGRLVNAKDDVPGGERIVVLSEPFWRTRFSSNPDVIGKSVSLNGASYRIVGVTPASFHVPQVDAELYAPVRVESPQEAAARGAHTLWAVVRVKTGVTPEQVRSEVDGIYAQLEKAYPETNTGVRPQLQDWQSFLARKTRSLYWMLLGAVAFVLLIAITNISGLLLTRTASRGGEIAVRSALGASRARLVRQLLLESLLLSLAGGGCGLLLAPWLQRVILSLAPAVAVYRESTGIDVHVLLFTAGASVLSGILFGLFPAMHSTRLDFNELLKQGARGTDGRSTRRLRSIMVAGELALALVLLVGAGLLLRSFSLLLGVQPGFDPDRLLTMNITLPLQRFAEIPKRTAFFRQALQNIESLPGVAAAGMNSELPLGSGDIFHNLTIEGISMKPGTEPEIHSRSISASYFRTMGIPILKGRAFNDGDTDRSQPVAIVNEAFVNDILNGQDPIGKRVRWSRAENVVWMTIVGVCGNTRSLTLARDDEPALYAPFAQEQQFWKTWMNVVVKANVEPLSLVAAVRKAVARVDPTIPVAEIKTMDQVIDRSVNERRFYLVLLAAFAGLALFLAALGIYGMISYSVTRSFREIGLRMALGAEKSHILRMVLSLSTRLALTGLAAGFLASLFLTRLLQSLLFEIGSTDPLTFGTVSLLLLAVSCVAAYLPARRAAATDPVVALRHE